MPLESLLAAMENAPELHEYLTDDDLELQELMPRLEAARTRGSLTSSELFDIARVKSRRRANDTRNNAPEDVIEITRVAFSRRSESAKIRVLTSLAGVGVPTASAILAWLYPDSYGVIDQRAWATLRQFNVVADGSPSRRVWFTPKEWSTYLPIVRRIAADLGQTPQRVDIWLYHYDMKSDGA